MKNCVAITYPIATKATPEMTDELPSMITLKQMVEQMSAIKQLLTLSPPSNEALDFIKRIEDMEMQASSILEVPSLFDDYNKYFNPLGWHAHDSMALPFLREATKLGKSGNIKEAESLIANYYIDNFDYFFIILRGLPTYFDRSPILDRAKERFFSEDYISCIPLILMMVDGFSNDVLNKGIFTEGSDFNAWDCLVSLNDNIHNYIKLITKTVRKTSNDPLDIPYRNGILHGLSINYNHKIVAIKSWALLFVVRDILIKKLNESSEKSKFEREQQDKENQLISFLSNPLSEFQKIIERADSFYNWSKSRTDEEWKMVARSGSPADYSPGSPEYALACFFESWSSCNYGKMASLIHRKPEISVGKLAGKFRNSLKDKRLIGFKIEFIQEERAGITFGTTLHLGNDEASWDKEAWFIVGSYLDGEKNFSKKPTGEWLLNDVVVSILCHMLSKDMPQRTLIV